MDAAGPLECCNLSTKQQRITSHIAVTLIRISNHIFNSATCISNRSLCWWCSFMSDFLDASYAANLCYNVEISVLNFDQIVFIFCSKILQCLQKIMTCLHYVRNSMKCDSPTPLGTNTTITILIPKHHALSLAML